jgi:hypothetical protein
MNNMRALLVGGATSDAERLAARLAPGATVICFAADRQLADALKTAITRRRTGARVSVMIGDPVLLVHKVSGPFDLIAIGADVNAAAEKQHERLRALLGENGEWLS